MGELNKIEVEQVLKIWNGLFILENPSVQKEESKEESKEEVKPKEQLSGKVRYKLSKQQDECEKVVKAYQKGREAISQKYAPLLKNIDKKDLLDNEAFIKRGLEYSALEEQVEEIKLISFKLAEFTDSEGNLLISQKVLNDLSILITDE